MADSAGSKSAERYPSYGLTSPPLVYRNLVITGSATQEFPPRGAAGAVRGWDAITGKLLWTFHSVPLPGQRGTTPGKATVRAGARA